MGLPVAAYNLRIGKVLHFTSTSIHISSEIAPEAIWEESQTKSNSLDGVIHIGEMSLEQETIFKF